MSEGASEFFTGDLILEKYPFSNEQSNMKKSIIDIQRMRDNNYKLNSVYVNAMGYLPLPEM